MIERPAAQEYSESIGQIGAGWWRQVAWAETQGIPKALGMDTREWVEHYLGGHMRMALEDRRAAVLELQDQGMSQREIAGVLGVGEATVSRDLNVPDGSEPEPTEQEPPASAFHSEPSQASAFDDLAETLVPEEERARHELDARLILDLPPIRRAVKQWAQYMTEEHRRIVQQAVADLTDGLRAGDQKLEVVR